MGLKQDLIDAKVENLKIQGVEDKKIDTSKGSPIEIEAELTKEAIIKFITESEFKITEMKAPMILERFNIPEQAANVSVETLLGPHGPVISTIKKLAGLIPGGSQLIGKLEETMQEITKPLAEGGTTVPELDINNSTGLETEGYVFIGDDPQSKNSFDVEDENGQREFTKVKLFRDDVEELL